MNEEIQTWYSTLSDQHKQTFLALVSNHLTIHGRSCGLDLAGEKQIAVFKALNELQHKLSQNIVVIGFGSDRSPEDTIIQGLQSYADHFGLSRQMKDSLEFARRRDFWIGPDPTP